MLVALSTFLIGTLIFLTYYYTSSSSILLIGYGYIVVAALINLYTIMVVYHGAKSTGRKVVLISIWPMFLNIPVMLVYVWFTLVLFNIARVTLVNSSANKMTVIEISGCETHTINELEPGESETVWISIANDCDVDLKYEVEGEKKSLNIIGYLCGGMGKRFQYNIEGTNSPEW